VNGKTISARSNLWDRPRIQSETRCGRIAVGLPLVLSSARLRSGKRSAIGTALAPAPGPLEPLPLERRTSNPPKQRSSLRQNQRDDQVVQAGCNLSSFFVPAGGPKDGASNVSGNMNET